MPALSKKKQKQNTFVSAPPCEKPKKRVGKVATAALLFKSHSHLYVNEILMPLNCVPASCYTANSFVPLSKQSSESLLI